MNYSTPLLALGFCLASALPSPAQLPPLASPAPTAAVPAATSADGPTPLNTPLKEETETLIACELTHAPTVSETRVFTSPKDADTAKGTWHYKLWLPKGYLASTLKKWPCMFILSPVGKADMGQMADHLKARGYVVVMLVESKNGPWGPIVGNFLAAHDDVVKRVNIEEGKKFVTGFSGGARASTLFVQARPGFGGVILEGAGPASINNVQGMQRNIKLYVAMIMGDADSNKGEVHVLKAALNAPMRFRDFSFAGGHQWAPKDVFEQAITWIEERNGMNHP